MSVTRPISWTRMSRLQESQIWAELHERVPNAFPRFCCVRASGDDSQGWAFLFTLQISV